MMNIQSIEPFCRLRNNVERMYDTYVDKVNEHFEWLDEILDQAKKALQNSSSFRPEMELLPRTPSQVKTRMGVKRRDTNTVRRSTRLFTTHKPSPSQLRSPMVIKARLALLSTPVDQASNDEVAGSSKEEAAIHPLVPESHDKDEQSVAAPLESTSMEEGPANQTFAVLDKKEENDTGTIHERFPVEVDNNKTFVLEKEEENNVGLVEEAVAMGNMETQTKSLDIVDVINAMDVPHNASPLAEKAVEQANSAESTGGQSEEPIVEEPPNEQPKLIEATGVYLEEPVLEEEAEEKPKPSEKPQAIAVGDFNKLDVSATSNTLKPKSQFVTRSASKKNLATPSSLTPRSSPAFSINRSTPQKSATKQFIQHEKLQEAAAKREEHLKQRIEEQKRKREERALKVAQTRLMQEAQREQLKRKIEEKYQTPKFDIEEKRCLRPRYPESAAKLQEDEQLRILEKAKEAERIRREQEEMQRLAARERERQQQQYKAPSIVAAAAAEIATSSKTSLTQDFSVKKGSSIYKHTSTVKLSTLEVSRGTFVVSSGSATNKCGRPESYAMTPPRVPKPSTASNYDISDLHSSDETDDEDNPRKKIPAWANGGQFNLALTQQFYHPPDLNELFGIAEMPDLTKMFKHHRKRFFKRTSSAQWDSPIRPHQNFNTSEISNKSILL